MNYVLVPKNQLEGKGFNYAETLPDGRAILNINVLKMLTGIRDVEIIDRASLLNLKKTQESTVEKKPEVIEPGLDSSDEEPESEIVLDSSDEEQNIQEDLNSSDEEPLNKEGETE